MDRHTDTARKFRSNTKQAKLARDVKIEYLKNDFGNYEIEDNKIKP